MRLRPAAVAAMAGAMLVTTPADGATVADAGALRADVTNEPWGLRLLAEAAARSSPRTRAPVQVLRGRSAFAPRESGAAPRACSARPRRAAITSPSWRPPTRPGSTIELRLRAAGEGVIGLDADVRSAPGPRSRRSGSAFWPQDGRALPRLRRALERGRPARLGGRELRRRRSVQPDEFAVIELFVPPWGLRPRDDATYYPVPWLLSSAGYGVLVDNPETSYFRPRPGRLVERRGGRARRPAKLPPSAPPPRAPEHALLRRARAGGCPERFTGATGRQPPPTARGSSGPGCSPAAARTSSSRLLDQLQAADAPMSVAQTYLHYLPCGDQQGSPRRRARAHFRRSTSAGSRSPPTSTR